MPQKLVENFIIKPDNYSKVVDALKESNSVSVQGNTYKALAVFRFSFTRPNQKNLNGRIYPYALWDKVIALSPTTLALADHPEEGPGKPHDIWAVVRNPLYSDDRSVLTADAYILDNELGRSAVAVLEAGGEVGLSSSGYGDFLSDGITVDPETFSLERYFDWVLQPSYEIFGNINDKILESDDSKGDDTMQENKKEMSLREKREFELSMTKIYEGTISIEDLDERLEKAKEALTFYEDVDSDAKKPDFEVLIAETEKAIEEKKDKKEDDDEDDDDDKNDDKSSDSDDDDEEKEEKAKKEAMIESLTKELEEQKAAYADLLEKKKESDFLLESFAKDSTNKIEYTKYEELRAYAENAVSLLNEKRGEINSLKAENLSIKNELVLSEKRLSVIMEKSFTEQEKAIKEFDSKIEKQKQEKLNAEEAKEKALVEGASEEVKQYYEDLVARGEKVEHMREALLTKKTLFEAQTYFFKNKNKVVNDPVSLIEADLSQPLTYGRGTPVTSSIEKRKGWL